MILRQYEYVQLIYDERESDAVKFALINLRRDLIRTLDCHINEKAAVPAVKIIVGTIGVCEEIAKKADIEALKGEDGAYRREAFLIQEKDGELLIAGTDRRGTIYGIYDFCEWLGVSPWYFFADVPVRRRKEAVIEAGFKKIDYPIVEYRGIFINDEEELEHWVWRYMGEETIGVKTYEKIFELLLRLKLNYIWPAMHVNSFNLKQENGALADRMGIVVGTSHCDMLMRSNNREWKPWLAKKGYTDVKYDYSIPGRNREILEEYWKESVEQNKEFEVSYTLGMRGIHDSGFETELLAGLTGETLRQAKIDLLESVIGAQQRILHEVLDKTARENPVKIFVPYKEVLELYDNGLKVPEDLTLIWTNDNYGYVRRYPGEKEKARKAGNGIYYHNSYWAPPGGSYLFVNTIPLSHTRNELKKAYEEGIRKLWVTNFGAIKPLEQQLTFYARLAWETGKENPVTDDEEAFLAQWLDKTFSGGFGAFLAPMLLRFDQVVNARKLEQMDCDAFSQTAYGDEAAARLHVLEDIFHKANHIYKELPKAERDAFYQLVLMRIHAAYLTNAMYYYADRSNLCVEQGKNKAAQLYAEQCKKYDFARRKMLYYYNKVMSNGKWDGILTPEDYPPPRTAMHPAYVPPLSVGKRSMVVTLWNDSDEIKFTDGSKDAVKWLEIANAGEGSFRYEIIAPKWLNCSEKAGIIESEKRILLWTDKEALKEECLGKECCDKLIVRNQTDGQEKTVPVRFCFLPSHSEDAAIEDDGRVVVEAGSTKQYKGFYRIANLGRNHGALMEARETGAVLNYPVFFTSSGSFLLELHRFPTLNSVGRIRLGISVDGEEIQVLESVSNDEHRGTWNCNVRNNVDKLYLQLPFLESGEHVISIHAMDQYVSFSRFVIYTKERRENSLGITGGGVLLPEKIDIDAFAIDFYGSKQPDERPVLYLPPRAMGDSVTAEDIFRQGMSAATVAAAEDENIAGKKAVQWMMRKVTPQKLLDRGNTLIEEENGVIGIDAVSAFAESPYAYTKNGPWQYCGSPSHRETGLAVYIRKEGLTWNNWQEAPSLHYRFHAQGGTYQVWILLHMWGENTSHFTIGFDGDVLDEKTLYGGTKIWRYSMEQVWKWVPVWETELTKGEHTFSVYGLSSHLRIDQIYITAGKELPGEEN